MYEKLRPSQNVTTSIGALKCEKFNSLQPIDPSSKRGPKGCSSKLQCPGSKWEGIGIKLYMNLAFIQELSMATTYSVVKLRQVERKINCMSSRGNKRKEVLCFQLRILIQKLQVGSNSACPLWYAFVTPPEGSINIPVTGGDIWLSHRADCFPAALKCFHWCTEQFRSQIYLSSWRSLNVPKLKPSCK